MRMIGLKTEGLAGPLSPQPSNDFPRAPQPPGGPAGLTRNVRILSLVSFTQDAASDLLYPILPLFVTSVLGAPPAALGAIEGTAEALAAISKAVSGKLADRRRRKPLVFFGYSLSALAKPVIGLAGAWPLVLFARALDRTGKGIRTSPRDAIIASETEASTRGAAFGFHRAADSAGAVLGPLIGLACYEALGQRLRPLFFVAFVPALISVILITLVREQPGGIQRPYCATDEAATAEPLPKEFWRVTALIGLFGLVNFSDVFLLLRARQLGFGFASVIGAYMLYNCFYAGLSYPAGKLSDRLSRSDVFGVGLGIFGLSYLGFALVGSAAWLWLLFPLYGGYTALTDGVGKAWVSDLVPASARGRGLGYFHSVSGAAALAASLAAGAFWGPSGFLPFVVAGTTALSISSWMLVGNRRSNRRSGFNPRRPRQELDV